jgi:flagellar biosynthesis protein FlhB
VPDRDQRTFPPSPRRVEEFRQRGEVARSRDVTQVATLAGGAALGLAFAEPSLRAMVDCMGRSLAGLGSGTPAAQSGPTAVVLWACLPVMTGAGAGYLLSSALQLGWPPALAWPRVNPGRIFSGPALGQLFSPRAMAGRGLKSTAKIAFCAAAAATAVGAEWDRFLETPALDAATLGTRIWRVTGQVTFRAGLALALLAVLDYALARRTMAAKMRMTRQEAQREQRQQDGDPMVRRRRKQRMRELGKRRLAVVVKKADVVLVNPTEYAVALRYRSSEDRAPRVVAKGKKHVAARIRELARKAGVPILVEPPLTRLLHKLCPEGREIPARLYQAVAEVLAHVYRVKGRTQ